MCQFDPIRYTLQNNNVNSNVRFSHPILGDGWLSASGKFYAKDAYTLQVLFDNFWVDGVNRWVAVHNSPAPPRITVAYPSPALTLPPLAPCSSGQDTERLTDPSTSPPC